MKITNISFINSKPLAQNKIKQRVSDNSLSKDFFVKSNNKIAFGSSKDAFTALEDGYQKEFKTKGEVYLYNFKIDKLEARNATLHGKSHAKNVKAKYITLFDNASADNLTAELSASFHSEGRVKNVKASNVDAQAGDGAFISNVDADHALVGMQTSVDIIHAREVEIINETFVDEVYAKKAQVSCEAQVRMINTKDARVRGNAFVEIIYAQNHVGLSGNAKVNEVVLGGDKASVALRDNPQFNSIVFEKGKGIVKLYKYAGQYPEIEESKIKGGEIVYMLEKTADNDFTYSNIEHLVEYKQNF